jgi:hypothetical protein
MRRGLKRSTWTLTLSLTALWVASCAAQQAPRSSTGRRPTLLVVIDHGGQARLSEEQQEQHRIIVERMSTQLLRSFSRGGYDAHVVEAAADSEAVLGARPGGYNLSLQIRRYVSGNARNRVVGQLFGVGGPSAEDAALLRTAYQLRDGEGRLMRSRSPMASSRHSWQEAVDELCRQTATEVMRTIREAREQTRR